MEGKLSVGIVTYSRQEAVLRSIQSVYDQGIDDIEVIVVDNNSQDGTGDVIRKRYPSIKYIRLPKNVGCPSGRNHTFSNCTGDYIVNLDDDGFLEQGTLELIEKAFNEDSTIGVIALKLCYTDQPDLSRASGEIGEDAVLFYGGVSAFRLKMLEEVGYYPDDFFQYHEEADLSLRILETDWRIVARPDIVMWHPRVGGGGGAKGTAWDYYRFRNALYIVTRHFPGGLFIKYFLGRLVSYFVVSIKRGTFIHYLRAVFSVLADMPQALRNKRLKAETIKRYFRGKKENASKGLTKF